MISQALECIREDIAKAKSQGKTSCVSGASGYKLESVVDRILNTLRVEGNTVYWTTDETVLRDKLAVEDSIFFVVEWNFDEQQQSIL